MLNDHALFQLGFRPFFLCAGILAVISMGAWLVFYAFGIQIMASNAPISWHAHEMIYGYSVAIIAGFLLTAIRNWTGQDTIAGVGLAVIVGLWILARCVALLGPLAVTAAADILFIVAFGCVAIWPIVKVRQWRQLPVIGILIGLLVGNMLYYAGEAGYLAQGTRWGIYLGFYLVVGLILLIGGRVIPSFIQGGVGYPVQLKKAAWVEIAIFIVYIVFLAVEVFASGSLVAVGCAATLTALNVIRMIGWYTHGIWRKPLLWSLYVAYGWITLGFWLYCLDLSPYIPVHAFGLGGIGLITVSMMSRVAWGHTGRVIAQPPALVGVIYVLVIIAAILRVLMPLALPGAYTMLIVISQICWLLAFALFLFLYVPVLTGPRVDGRPG